MKLQTRAFNVEEDCIEDIVDMFLDMTLETPQSRHFGDREGFEVDRGQVLAYLNRCVDPSVEHTTLIVGLIDGKVQGCIGGWYIPMIFAKSAQLAHELPWYVRPCKGRAKLWFKLLEAYEEWAKREGCDATIIGYHEDRMKPLYEKRGYHPHITTMMKRMN